MAPELKLKANAPPDAETERAQAEINRRAAMLVLQGELVGDHAVLAVIRSTLSCYLEAVSFARRDDDTLEDFHPLPGVNFALRDSWYSTSSGRVLFEWSKNWHTGVGYEPAAGALILQFATLSSLPTLVRILEFIEAETRRLKFDPAAIHRKPKATRGNDGADGK